MGHLNSAQPDDESTPYAADEIAITGKDPNAQNIPAWKAYLNRMGSGMGQPSRKPSWASVGSGLTTALIKKFRPSEGD